MHERECTRVEAAVVAAMLENEPLPPPIAAHLAACPVCRRFADGVALAPAVVANGPEVSRELRRRTLAAAATAGDVGGSWAVILLLGAAVVVVVNIVASLVVPVGLVAAVLGPLLPRSLALLAAVTLTSSIGLAVAAVLLITLDRTAGRVPVLEVVR